MKALLAVILLFNLGAQAQDYRMDLVFHSDTAYHDARKSDSMWLNMSFDSAWLNRLKRQQAEFWRNPYLMPDGSYSMILILNPDGTPWVDTWWCPWDNAPNDSRIIDGFCYGCSIVDSSYIVDWYDDPYLDSVRNRIKDTLYDTASVTLNGNTRRTVLYLPDSLYRCHGCIISGGAGDTSATAIPAWQALLHKPPQPIEQPTPIPVFDCSPCNIEIDSFYLSDGRKISPPSDTLEVPDHINYLKIHGKVYYLEWLPLLKELREIHSTGNGAALIPQK